MARLSNDYLERGLNANQTKPNQTKQSDFLSSKANQIKQPDFCPLHPLGNGANGMENNVHARGVII